MKRLVLLVMAALCVAGMDAKKVYLNSLASDYAIQNGDTLIGTLTSEIKLSITSGTMTLKDADINSDGLFTKGDWAGISVTEGAVTLNLVGKNKVRGFKASNPGIYVGDYGVLTIDGDGELEAVSSGNYSAGIGGDKDCIFGDIIIKGGSIIARGGAYSAGIGGAFETIFGTITIEGSATRVEAHGGYDAPYSVGAGKNSVCGKIIVGGKSYEEGFSEHPYIYERYELITQDGIFYQVDKYPKTARVVKDPEEKVTYSGEITIPEKITYGGSDFTVNAIARSAFEKSEVTEIILPATLDTIGDYAFSSSKKLTSITFPAALRVIDKYAFRNCTQLSSIAIPASVDSIGKNAFMNCKGVTAYTVDKANMRYFDINGVLYTKDKTALLAFPNSSTTATEVTLYAETEIETRDIFRECPYLTAIHVEKGNKNFFDVDGVFFWNYTYHGETTSYLVTYPLAKPGTSYAIPEAAQKIDSRAFANNQNLLMVTIPATVTYIGSEAFANMSNLSHIILPASITGMGDNVFDGCTGVKSILSWMTTPCGSATTFNGVPNAIPVCVPKESMEAYKASEAWKNFTHFVGLPLDDQLVDGIKYNLDFSTFTATVKALSDDAEHYEGEITLPDIVTVHGFDFAVTAIDKNAFKDCLGLTAIQVAEENPYFASEDGVLFSKDKKTLLLYPAGKEGHYTIASSVTAIGPRAFRQCSHIAILTNKAEGPQTVGENAFDGVPVNAMLLVVPDGKEEAYSLADGWKAFTHIMGKKKDIKIGAIQYSLAAPALRATVIALPGTDKYEGDITIPDNVKWGLDFKIVGIAANAFADCPNLQSVSVPASVEDIEKGAFANASQLTAINVDEGNEHYTSPEGVLFFKNKSYLVQYPIGKDGTSYVLPEEVEGLSEGAFAGAKLTSITFSEALWDIEDKAFDGCAKLTSLNLPESIDYIGPAAFRGCAGLTRIILIKTAPPTTAADAFEGVHVDIPVYVPKEAIEDYKNQKGWTNFTHFVGSPIDNQLINGINYSLDLAHNSATVVALPDDKKYEGEITLPASVTYLGFGFAVTAIDKDAFIDCLSLTAIQVAEDNLSLASEDGVLFSKDKKTLLCYPAGKEGDYTIAADVTAIGPGAFRQCTHITILTNMAEEPQTVGENAFDGVPVDAMLLKVPFETEAAYAAAEGWKAFTHIIADYKTVNIDGINYYLTFEDFTATVTALDGEDKYVGDVVIPDKVKWAKEFVVTSIDNAFNGCSELTSVSAPASVVSFSTDFEGANKLTSINVAEGNTVYLSINGVLFTKDQTTLLCYPVGKQGTYTVPESVEMVGWRAFANCRGLTAITLQAGVLSIEDEAFSGCVYLASITSLATTPPECAADVFKDVPKTIPVYVPESAILSYKTADGWKEFVNYIDEKEKPDTPTAIENSEVRIQKAEKLLLNGHLLILVGEKTYDTTGRLVE